MHRASLWQAQVTCKNLISLQQHNAFHAHISACLGDYVVPWIGQDFSKSKGEGKLLPVNAIKA